MSDIIELEIKNLSKKEKKEWHNFLQSVWPERMEWTQGNVERNTDFKNLKKYKALDELLKDYFKRYPDHFIGFQHSNKNSLYNQTIKQHDFKDFDYEDMVKDLTQEEKDEVIWDIATRNWSPEHVGSHYWNKEDIDKDIEEVSFWDINPKHKKEMEDYKKLPENLKAKYDFVNYYPEIKKNLDKYLKNEFVFFTRTWEDTYKDFRFFKNKDELIVFALEDGRIAPEILHKHEKILNPHYKVNNWIETKYELELTQKDDLDQTQKFEEPKLKM
ncbi:hypothetical protein [Mesomycoplasma ovipneumoniae]|uniref:hypothetical protein n=1 Tax=Mesomycoplasma ovipneumoniae TaxID=29562 RepID=UPI003080050E